MPLVVSCRSCGSKLKVPEGFTARKAKCARCGGVIPIERNGTPSPTAAPPKPRTAARPTDPQPKPKPRPAEAADYEVVEDEAPPQPRRRTPPRPEPEDPGFEVVEDEEPPRRPSRRTAPVEAEPVEEEEVERPRRTRRPSDQAEAEPAEDGEEERPRKKKKKKKRRQQEEGETAAWVWWACGLAALVFLVVLGLVGAAFAGYKAEAVIVAVELAIMVPVSMVILIVSMLLSSSLAGGINFGEVHLGLLKAAILIIVVDLVTLLPLGGYLAFPVWLFGLMYLYDLDLWEARFLVAVNWALNFVFKWLMLALIIAMLMKGKLDPDALDFHAPARPAATQEDKALDMIDRLGGDYEDDENADDLRVLSVTLAGTKVTDGDLAHLKSFPSMQRLDLHNTQISDQGLTHLKGLGQLQLVNLQGTRVTPGGIQELQKALPRAKILR